MWLMLQQDTPEDYVIATGEAYTVREFVEWSFAEVGISLKRE
jgi:GDPmannose 4,6-dehydratase